MKYSEDRDGLIEEVDDLRAALFALLQTCQQCEHSDYIKSDGRLVSSAWVPCQELARWCQSYSGYDAPMFYCDRHMAGHSIEEVTQEPVHNLEEIDAALAVLRKGEVRT